MTLRALCILAVLSVHQFGWCDSEESIAEYEKYEDEEFKKAERDIPKVVERYASAMGCEFSMDPGNVIPYSLGERQGYLAVYSLDLGCTGGSNMVVNYFAFLQRGFPFHIVVNPAYSNPAQSPAEFPRHEAKIYLKDGEAWFRGLVPDRKKDALCCASVPVKGKVTFSKGKWAASIQ